MEVLSLSELIDRRTFILNQRDLIKSKDPEGFQKIKKEYEEGLKEFDRFLSEVLDNINEENRKDDDSVFFYDCPQCGSFAKLTHLQLSEKDFLFSIMCDQCDFSVEPNNNPDQVIENWNRIQE